MPRSRYACVALFTAAVLAFLLPFGTVSCSEPPVTFTGAQLATSTVHGGDADVVEQIEADALLPAVLAAGSALLGLGLAVAGRRGQGSAALVALVSLLLLPWIAVSEFADFAVGYGFALACLALAAVVGTRAWLLLRRRRAERRRVWPAVVGLSALALFAGVTMTMCLDTSAAGATGVRYAVAAASSSTAGTSFQSSSSL